MEISIGLGANPVDEDILLAATRDYPEALPLLLDKVPKAVLTYLSKTYLSEIYPQDVYQSKVSGPARPVGLKAIDEAIRQGPAGLKAFVRLLES